MSTHLENNKDNQSSISREDEVVIKPEILDPPASEEYPGQRPKEDKRPKKPQQSPPDMFPDRNPEHFPETEPSRHRIQYPDL